MYQCPNCNANLKFNIERQGLFCEACETLIDPYDFHKEQDAEEYEAMVFVCPQCGGRLITEDTTAATFCSFCGGTAILDSRISREKAPASIIPFQKTREDCRNAYRKMMRHAFFAPREFKEKSHIEKFRGIYMPYWVYSVKKDGEITLRGTKTLVIDDDIVYRYYKIKSKVFAEVNGLAYDASASFADSLSSAIAPFDLRERQDFTPSFLSGFYADTSDVERYTYQEEAKDIAEEQNCISFLKEGGCRDYGLESGEYRTELASALRPDQTDVQLTFLPVWFLAYRRGDRVAYATVNGQTGKAAADMPVDIKKYLLASMLLAVPLFVFFNLIWMITPAEILGITALLAFFAMLFCNLQTRRLRAKEEGRREQEGYYKKGVLGRHVVLGGQTVDKLLTIVMDGVLMPLTVPLLVYGQIDFVRIYVFGVIAVLLLLQTVGTQVWSGLFSGRLPQLLPGLGNENRKAADRYLFWSECKQNFRNCWKALVSVAAAAVILLINPGVEMVYYAGAFTCMLMVIWTILDLISFHNRLCTRPLPQLGKRGGDEYGY